MSNAQHAVRFARALALVGIVSAGCEEASPDAPDATESLDALGLCGHCTCWDGDVGPSPLLDAFVGDAGPPPDSGPACASISPEASRCCAIVGPLFPPDLAV